MTRKQDFKIPLPIKEAITVTPDCGEWEIPPARTTARGRKTYRRGSVRRIKNLGGNTGEVEKAKGEYSVDKFVKSANESVRSRLSWWRKRAKEHKISLYPVTVEHLQLLGTL